MGLAWGRRLAPDVCPLRGGGNRSERAREVSPQAAIYAEFSPRAACSWGGPTDGGWPVRRGVLPTGQAGRGEAPP
eukprot:6947846-Alexandrium_andersonii.AAC.1